MADSSHKTNSSTLLPPSSSLLPASDPDKSFGEGKAGSQEIADELARVGSDAKAFIADAAGKTAEKAPELKKMATDAGKKIGSMAEAGMKEGNASFLNARTALKAKVQSETSILKKPKFWFAIASALVIVSAIGFWAAQNKATTVAKDKIDTFLVRNNLSHMVSYGDISASIFGSATLSDVRITTNPGAITHIGSLEISDLELNGSALKSISLSGQSIEIPVLALARANPRSGLLRTAIGLGYTTLDGQLSLSLETENNGSQALIHSAATMKGAGSWDATVKLGGVDSGSIGNLSQKAFSAMTSHQVLAWLVIMAEGMDVAKQMTLIESNITIENNGLIEHGKEFPDLSLPASERGDTPASSQFTSAHNLIQYGLTVAEAERTSSTLQSWAQNGGTLKLTSNLSHPISIVGDGRNSPFIFSSLDSFIAQTKSMVEHQS